MALDGRVLQLFEEIKYRHGFPPRNAAGIIKSQLALQGLGQSGALAQEVSGVYLKTVEAVLDELAAILLERGGDFDVKDEEGLRVLMANAHEQLFNEARGLIMDELSGAMRDYQRLAVVMIDEQRGPVWQHLKRTLDLRSIRPGSEGGVSKRESHGTNAGRKGLPDISSVHPDIREKCGPLFDQGAYAEAVEKSFKVVRDRLRDLTGKETGSEAFGKGRLHIRGAAAPNVDHDFNEAVKFLAMAVDRFRNEKSHTSDARIDDPVRAYEYLRMSSLAMRLLEDAEVLE